MAGIQLELSRKTGEFKTGHRISLMPEGHVKAECNLKQCIVYDTRYYQPETPGMQPQPHRTVTHC